MDYIVNTKNITSIEDKYHFTSARIDGCYSNWSITLPSGKIKIGDKLYLSVPNGWDDRLVYYPWYCGHIYWDSNQYTKAGENAPDITHPPYTSSGAQWNDVYYGYYHGNETNLLKEIKDNVFPYKLLIDYGEYKNIELLPNYLWESHKQLELIKFKINVVNGNEIRFMIKSLASDLSVAINFGDSEEELLSDTSYVSHTYNSSGEYIITIKIVNGYREVCKQDILCPVDSSLPIIYDVEQGTSVLVDTYISDINPNTCFSLMSTLVNCELNNFQYIKNIDKSDDNEFKYFNLINSSVNNLYCYASSGYFKLIMDDTSSILNLHLGSNIDTLDFSSRNVTELVKTKISNIYVYGDDLTILVKNNINNFSYSISGEEIYLGNNIKFYVKSSNLAKMRLKYPLLNIFGIE